MTHPLLLATLLAVVGVERVRGDAQLTEETSFANVKFSRTVFFDNTSLADDITLLDKEFKEAVSKMQPLQFSAHHFESEPLMDGAVPSRLELHVLLVTDYSMFEAFRDLYGEDFYAIYHALHEYSRSIFDQASDAALSTIFDRLTFVNGTKIVLKLSGVLPVIRPEDCPLRGRNLKEINETTADDYDAINGTAAATNASTENSRSVDALEAVHLIQDWISTNQALLPVHDHAILLTKFDLLSMRNESSTQGMAYVSSMCRGSESVSVVEDVGGFTSATIAAHELAHTLGALHDGTGPSKSCHPRDNYMMSPSVSSFRSGKFDNTVLLSRCSIRQIDNFLRSPDSKCLRKHSEKPRGPRRLITEKRPSGEIFDKNTQCKFAFGTDYAYCAKYDIRHAKEDPCRRLWCRNRRKDRHAPCETKGYLPLMDGSECGSGRWCVSGRCVSNGKEVLDDSCQDVNTQFCQAMCPVKMAAFCQTKSFAEVCCHSCRQRQQSEAGDEFRKKLKPHKVPVEEL